YIQRLDRETTSFFFTNFPVDANEEELWSSFARYGRVGEVYIPKKLDKQGRRFGFVKFRDVRDIESFLITLSDIWIGTYKLRINRSRFRRDEDRKGKKEQHQPPKEAGAKSQQHVQQGISFKEVLSTE
ncbi:endonuclease/exonuclease/phosphatase family protein, partial [Trifolium medium]|nr:endonuclease/exonuclease/phosphatase family protein [Trifolium medium]